MTTLYIRCFKHFLALYPFRSITLLFPFFLFLFLLVTHKLELVKFIWMTGNVHQTNLYIFFSFFLSSNISATRNSNLHNVSGPLVLQHFEAMILSRKKLGLSRNRYSHTLQITYQTLTVPYRIGIYFMLKLYKSYNIGLHEIVLWRFTIFMEITMSKSQTKSGYSPTVRSLRGLWNTLSFFLSSSLSTHSPYDGIISSHNH